MKTSVSTTGEESIYRSAMYIGSFSVEEQDNNKRTHKIQKELESLRNFNQSKNVLVCISTRGIKICSADLKVVYMAHALRRVSYATCDAPYCQVAFLAREPMGVTNLQYCHVFVTKTSFLAEELNQIIGDAFKFAYVRQRLLKLHRNGKLTNSPDMVIPLLSDRYSIWSNDSSPNTTFELPPPPSNPPPPPTHVSPTNHDLNNPHLTLSNHSLNQSASTATDSTSNGFSTNEISNLNGCFDSSSSSSSSVIHISNSSFISSSSSTTTTTTTTTTITNSSIDLKQVNCDSSSLPLASSLPNEVESKSSVCSDSAVLVNGHNNCRQQRAHETIVNSNEELNGGGRSDLDKKIDRLSFPQGIDLAFVRRHFLRRSEGKGNQSSGGSTLGHFRGGSARQPRLRQGLNFSNFLSSVRHSSFFPSSTQHSFVENEDEDGAMTSQFSSSHDVTDLLSGQSTFKRPPIFVDLRTFAGGSPVVALKERLDAQAIADAKASAFAEAAAVLAAAKQVSVHNSMELNKQTPMAKAVVVGRGINESCASGESSPPPVPPIRMHSLQRSHAFSKPSPQQSSSLTSCSSQPLHEMFTNDGRSQVATSQLDDTGRNLNSTSSFHELLQSNLTAPSVSSSRGLDASNNERSRKSKSMLMVLDSRNRLVCPQPSTTQLDEQCISPLCFPTDDLSNQHFQTPTHHVAADANRRNHSFVHNGVLLSATSTDVGKSFHAPSIQMTCSTLSTDTPTPTATPTPTPERNAQVFPTFADVDEMNVLKQAPWFQALLPREIAFELLAREETGSFLVRNSATHPGCCALSVRVPIQDNPTGITHYLIQKTRNGVRLKGLDKEWPSLQALVTHLTVIPEMLPCLLKLPASSNNPIFTLTDVHLPKSHHHHHHQQQAFHKSNGQTPHSSLSETQSAANPIHVTSHGSKHHVTPVKPKPPPNVESDVLTNGTPTNQRTPDCEQPSGAAGDDYEDEDYQRLSDFSSIMADLNLAKEDDARQ